MKGKKKVGTKEDLEIKKMMKELGKENLFFEYLGNILGPFKSDLEWTIDETLDGIKRNQEEVLNKARRHEDGDNLDLQQCPVCGKYTIPPCCPQKLLEGKTK